MSPAPQASAHDVPFHATRGTPPNLPGDSPPLPPSLYRSCPPPFWSDDLPWPPFGPDVPDAATNRIPAQRHYEAIAAGEP